MMNPSRITPFAALLLGLLALPASADSNRGPGSGPPPAADPTLVVQWNETLLECIRIQHLGPPMTARAIAMTYTAGFDAWACYDDVAVPTLPLPDFRRPVAERDEAHRRTAFSFAVYRTLRDLFPAATTEIDARMSALGLDPADAGTDLSTASGVGNACAANLLAFRHADGSNQLGDLHPGAYSDYTGYVPVNTVDQILDPNRWQPLVFSDGAGGTVVPSYIGPFWGEVTPFAMARGDALRPAGPARWPDRAYSKQIEEILRLNEGIDDRGKVIAEYWADGPRSEQPPGHWSLFAEGISARDHHTFSDDVKLYFTLGNALMDAGIAVWEAKHFYDAERPITAIRFLRHGQTVRATVPFQGRQEILGDDWLPYQPTTFISPPFAEYPSGHSGFSAAGAEVLKRFTGSDRFDGSVTIAAGSSKVEPGLAPSRDVTLRWNTFSDAADEAGYSRRLGGIHFVDADLDGRVLGRRVAALVWDRAQQHILGVSGPVSTVPETELQAGEAGPEAAATRFALGPNPTPGRLRVSFSVSREEDVQASVLDLQGREVARLADGRLTAGVHELSWDGSRQTPGVYFLRLRRGGVSETRRVLIAR